MPDVSGLPLRRAMTIAGWIMAAGGLVTAWIMGVPRLERYASTRHVAKSVQIRFTNPPGWLGGDLEKELVLAVSRHIDPDPLARSGLVAASKSLAATGWFEEIRQVRRVNQRLVEVDARFAYPFAVIRDAAAGRDHLVDPRGRLLPRSYPSGQTRSFAVIDGASFDRPPRQGELWPGADVTAALKVMHLIHDRPWRGQLVRIDISRYAKEASIRLITDRGCVVLWGRAPGEERGGEVTAQQKLSYLDYHHQHYGHIDRGFLQELDVTGDVVIGR